MAYGDTNTAATSAADGGGFSYTYAPKTAQQDEWVTDYPREQSLFLDDKERAEAAGVTSVDKIDYAAALRNYESRSDVELFRNRRAREYADTFEAQDFARQDIQIAAPLQSSTVGTTSVVKGDDFTDTLPASTGPSDPAGDGKDDTVVQPDRT